MAQNEVCEDGTGRKDKAGGGLTLLRTGTTQLDRWQLDFLLDLLPVTEGNWADLSLDPPTAFLARPVRHSRTRGAQSQS